MTNNEHENDDFIEPEIGAATDTPPPGMIGNVREAWQKSPFFKFMVLLVGVFAVGVAAASFLGGGKDTQDLTHLAKPPGFKEAPGGEASPYVKQQTELANKNRADQAIANGGSALPTPIGQSPDTEAPAKDTQLNELRAEMESMRKQQQQGLQQQPLQQSQQQLQQQQALQQQRQQEQMDNTLAEAMQRQMQQLLDGWSSKSIKNVSFQKADEGKVAADSQGTAQQQSSAAQAALTAQNTNYVEGKILVPAGTVSYAQLLTEANSDVPGPIMAQIVSGPLSGFRAIGSFQVTTNYEKYLILKFALADKKGKEYKIDAIALDPNTTLGGMATEVDERYMVRLVLPAAAGFLEGMGEAMGQNAQTVTQNGNATFIATARNGYRQGIYRGAEESSRTASQFFQNQANQTKPLVRVAAGTPMGLFFVAPVHEPVAGQEGMGYPQQAAYPYGGLRPQNQPGSLPYPVNYQGGPNGMQGYGAGGGYQDSSNSVPYPNYAAPQGGGGGGFPGGMGGGFGGYGGGYFGR